MKILVPLFFFIFNCVSLSAADKVSDFKLIPYPKQVEFSHKTFSLSKEVKIITEKDSKVLRDIADTFAKDLKEKGFVVFVNSTGNHNESGVIHLLINKESKLGKEGYQLNINKKVSLTASNSTGLFWGTRTLLQLYQNGPQSNIPYGRIKDSPDFSYRGLLIDNARHFHSLDFHIKTIKRLSSYKINHYQIHFSDHQSYTLPSKDYPELPTIDRSYSVSDIKKLVEVSKRYHVMLVPEIDVPGHAGALIRGLMKEVNLGCSGDRKKLCLGKQKTYQILKELFTEVMKWIPSEYWHLGADEVHYNLERCGSCKTIAKENGLTDGKALFNYFINRMNKFIKSKGRKMIVWEGFSPLHKPTVDKDIIVCPFDIKHRGHMPLDYLKAGYKLLNTSWTPLYIADDRYMTTPEEIARWWPYHFGAGRSPQPFAYWKKIDPIEYKGSIIGAQMCSWDNEERAEEGMIFGTGPGFYKYGRPGPRLQIMADRVWNTPTDSNQLMKSGKELLERVGASYWRE